MNNGYRDILEKLHALQRSRVSSIEIANKRLALANGPPTRQSGLYWIYTTYTDNDFQHASPSSKKGSVDFKRLACRHSRLANICTDSLDNFRVVYNGIGGVGSKGGGGLRERILAEFRGGEGTGSLAVTDGTLGDLSRWRYSYVLWAEIDFVSPYNYSNFAAELELLWRIQYGWPVLCCR